MSSLTVFEFESKEIRFVGTDECPEWIAQDVCNALENGDAYNILRNFDEDEKGMYYIQTLGGVQKVLTVKEPGFYRLIFKYRTKIAKRFQRWLFHEDLPQIRKTGRYEQQKVLPLSRETQANLLFALKDIHDVDPDDRTRVILKAQIINLVESAQQADPEPQLLSVTEICEMNGIKIPHGKDSMLGKMVARTWRQIYDTDPQVCKKHLDTGHVSEIKAYPPEFFERVIAVAQEYLK